MRLLLSLFGVGSLMACCGLPPIDELMKREAEDVITPPEVLPEELPPPAPEPVVPKVGGPTHVVSLEMRGADCALVGRTVGRTAGGEERVLAALRGVCPTGADLVAHPDGNSLLVTDPTGTTVVDVATSRPSRLPDLEGVRTVRWDATGRVVAIAAEAAPAPTADGSGGQFVTVDGERLLLSSDGASAMQVEVGRQFVLDGGSWKRDKAFLGYGHEGMAPEDVFAEQRDALAGIAPGGSGGAIGDIGRVLEEGEAPAAGAWRQDGALAFHFEWLEGVLPEPPLALRLADGTWSPLGGFDGLPGTVVWEERADVLWVSAPNAPRAAVYDLATGGVLWEAASPAWLLPNEVVFADAVAVADAPPAEGPGGARRERAGGSSRPSGAQRSPSKPAPPPAEVEEDDEEMPDFEPPPERPERLDENGKKPRKPRRGR